MRPPRERGGSTTDAGMTDADESRAGTGAITGILGGLGLGALAGLGVLSGVIPVTLFPAGLAIDHAKLAAESPGVLRYNQAQGPAALQGAGDSVKMAMSALSDFHYDKLEIDLDRAATGDTELGLHIAGRNPSFYNGYPVEFNLAVTGRLDEALRKGLAGYQVPDMIRERLKQYGQ